MKVITVKDPKLWKNYTVRCKSDHCRHCGRTWEEIAQLGQPFDIHVTRSTKKQKYECNDCHFPGEKDVMVEQLSAMTQPRREDKED